MKDVNPSLDPELLLAQTAWVQGLARRLISDPSRAEDAAQEVLATAVARPPKRVAGEAYLRAWLTRVLRNFVVTSRLRDGRRRAREERAARPERQDSTAAIVERAEEHRIVVETVLGLDDPYRTALLLRFFAGRSAAQIAAAMDCSPEAARKRISRGLAQMRRALDARHGGDRGAWQRSLFALAGARPWRLGIPAGLGRIMIVSTKMKLVVGGLLVLAGAIVLWRPAIDGGRVGPTTVESSGSSADVASVPPALRGTAAEPAGRVEVDPFASPVLRALRVRDVRTGAPLAGVRASTARPATWAELRADLERCWEALDIADRASRWTRLAGTEELAPVPGTTDVAPFVPRGEEAAGMSDAEGMLVLEAPPTAGAGLVLRLEGTFPGFLAPDAVPVDEDILEVTLLPAGRLEVLVVDPDGRPVPDAHVRIEHSHDPIPSSGFGLPLPPLLDEVRWHGPTDAAGRVSVDPVPTGIPLFVTVLGEFQSSPPYEPQIYVDPSRPTASLEIEVSFVGAIEGLVLDLDENPLEGVVLWYVEPNVPSLTGGASIHPAVATDSGGRYRFDDVVVGRGEVWAVDAYQFVRDKKPVAVRAGNCTTLEPFILAPYVGVSGRLVSEIPFDPGRLSVRIRDGERGSFSREARESGSFRFEVPSGEYVVQVSGKFGVNVLTRQEVVAPSRDVEIRLDGLLGAVIARVEDGAGVDCIPRIRFHAIGSDGLMKRDYFGSLKAFENVPIERGVFQCLSLVPGEYAMFVDAGELGGACIQSVHVRAGEITDLGRIAIGMATLRGRVTDSGGNPVPRVRVTISSPAPAISPTEPVWKREATTDAGGLYSIPSIRPSAWVVHAETADGCCSERSLVPLTADQEERLDLVLAESACIRGRVVRNGDPVVGVEVSIQWRDSPLDAYVRVRMEGNWSDRTDIEGEFELGPFLSGSYTLFVSSNPYRRKPLELSAGQVATLEFVLDGKVTRLRFPTDERLPGRVGRVFVSCLDLSSPFYAEGRSARRLSGNEFEVDLFSTPSFLTASVGAYDKYWYAVLDGENAGDLVDVVFPRGVVEVAIPDECVHAPPPRLILVAVPEGDVWASTGTNWTLPRDDSDPGSMRFLCVPSGARLRFEGADRAGRDFTREFTYPGPGPMRIDWP